MSEQVLNIDIVSDVVCPWCIIGYKRLEVALQQMRLRESATIRWHPFELNPQMPEGGQNLRQHLAQKYGTTVQDSINARERLTAYGEELGFQFDYFDDMRMFNTYKAHQLMEFAHENGKATELKLRLFHAFFGERKAVDQVDVLVAEANAVGLSAAEATAALVNGTYADAVRTHQNLWLQKGVHAVPAFVINDQIALSGAQDIGVFKRALHQVQAGD